MGKYVENPKYTSKALFEELFNRKKVLLVDRQSVEFVNDEIEQINEQIVEHVQQEIASAPVQEVPAPVAPAPVSEPVAEEKPKRAPYSGIGPRAYHISKNKKGEWQIKATGESSPLIAFKELARMVAFSKVLADKNGATVRFHDENGKISTLY